MSILTEIDDIPLFSSKQEAISWARKYDLVGYHVHVHAGEIGYMGGITHAEINKKLNRIKKESEIDPSRKKQVVEQPEPNQQNIANVQAPPIEPIQQIASTPSVGSSSLGSSSTGGGSTGGGGGGGGY